MIRLVRTLLVLGVPGKAAGAAQANVDGTFANQKRKKAGRAVQR